MPSLDLVEREKATVAAVADALGPITVVDRDSNLLDGHSELALGQNPLPLAGHLRWYSHNAAPT